MVKPLAEYAVMAPVGVVDGDVGVAAVVGVDVGAGVGVEVVPLVELPPQATSRTARIKLHKARVVP